MDNGKDKSNEIDKILYESRHLNIAISEKQALEYTLKQLTLCNNLAALSKTSESISQVFNISIKVTCDSSGSLLQASQTLVITIENVSEKFELLVKNWQFQVDLNDNAHGSWTLKNTFSPGSSERFCVPLTKQNFKFPFMKISISLKFIIPYDSKIYSKTFEVMDCTVDVLDCLDPEKYLVDNDVSNLNKSVTFVDISDEIHQTTIEFPPLTRFLLRVDNMLKEIFVKDVLLQDSMHRGFENRVEELSTKTDFSIFYLGTPIDVNMSNSGIINVSCSNPALLCAVKVAVLKRLVIIEGMVAEPLNGKDEERLHTLRMKLKSSAKNGARNASRLNVDELMHLYLELRDIGESIRYCLNPLVE